MRGAGSDSGTTSAQFTLVPLGKKKGSLEGWWARSRSDLIKEKLKKPAKISARKIPR